MGRSRVILTWVMVMDLVKCRKEDYRGRIEKWMEVQKEERIYDLGSLPPFLLVFGGDVVHVRLVCCIGVGKVNRGRD